MTDRELMTKIKSQIQLTTSEWVQFERLLNEASTLPPEPPTGSVIIYPRLYHLKAVEWARHGRYGWHGTDQLIAHTWARISSEPYEIVWTPGQAVEKYEEYLPEPVSGTIIRVENPDGTDDVYQRRGDAWIAAGDICLNYWDQGFEGNKFHILWSPK